MERKPFVCIGTLYKVRTKCGKPIFGYNGHFFTFMFLIQVAYQFRNIALNNLINSTDKLLKEVHLSNFDAF